MLNAMNITVGYGDRAILKNLSVSIPEGKVTALIGPNGCGKSTLLKTLSRVITPSSGLVQFNGRPLNKWVSKAIAQHISLLPQNLHHPEGITVRQLVEYGRTPYVSHWGRLTQADQHVVEQAMVRTGVDELQHTLLDNLSGGQRQRAWIAMILAQDTEVVMLDEPTTFLDLSHQIELMHIIRDMQATGKTVVVVLHDLNQAARYCDHLVVLKGGAIEAEGEPEVIMTHQLLDDVFSVKARVVADPVSGTPLCVPL
ncbi:Fe(3+) dicitrate ABC transporter ATP-binding protein FecE [Photobacterium sp. CAU 1568]|uniref:Fe(3+) dicitrate ABC transporter ATP-binding protein FecE n=1 Tax=Photobacterium arenosum TaxID=2774143 RepID=A0ABR9BR41_9GAMM|nr:Fe(3+) dicitrate ABC transporter ATP-binding protein FecE [Photobacterium arenosum]MBD8513951.1 Fe(3+) dicitrate ABC transporter ATP-binding protein FecE [Photobacterium arenosum]